MANDLDLEFGDEERADASPAERRRMARADVERNKQEGEGRSRASRGTSGSKKRTTTPAAAQREDNEVTSRLLDVFERITNALEERGDEELATIIREDAGAMTQGLVSLTKSVKFLRKPLLILLNFVQPVLAFGRTGRVLWGRFRLRQERLAYERQGGEQVTGEVV